MSQHILFMHVHARLILLSCLFVLLLVVPPPFLPHLPGLRVHLLLLLLLMHGAAHLCMEVHVIREVLVVFCPCRGAPFTTWMHVVRVPGGGEVPKLFFRTSRRFASCLRGGGRSRAGCCALFQDLEAGAPEEVR